MASNTENSHTPTKYWTLLDDGKVRCDLCHRGCSLKEGQRGVCYVRMAQGSEIVLTTYGRSSGLAVDPIEKKPLSHFYPGSTVFSFGTAGCNLTCKFCQNWDISRSREADTLSVEASPTRIAEAAKARGCKSVAFTYNEPIIFLEYAVDTAIACHDIGVKTVAVTAGDICERPRQDFFAHIDAANVDLKAFTDRFYRQLCGGHLEPVLDTLIYLKNEISVWLELTTLLIPGENDSDAELDEMTSWVVDRLGPDVPMHFTAFHPSWKMMNHPPTPSKTLMRAREIAIQNGVRYAYTGNVRDVHGSSTFCHGCGELLIGRDWHRLLKWNLTAEGCCRECGTVCAGVFGEAPDSKPE